VDSFTVAAKHAVSCATTSAGLLLVSRTRRHWLAVLLGLLIDLAGCCVVFFLLRLFLAIAGLAQSPHSEPTSLCPILVPPDSYSTNISRIRGRAWRDCLLAGRGDGLEKSEPATIYTILRLWISNVTKPFGLFDLDHYAVRVWLFTGCRPVVGAWALTREFTLLDRSSCFVWYRHEHTDCCFFSGSGTVWFEV